MRDTVEWLLSLSNDRFFQSYLGATGLQSDGTTTAALDEIKLPAYAEFVYSMQSGIVQRYIDSVNFLEDYMM
jgi:hypothetical protein